LSGQARGDVWWPKPVAQTLLRKACKYRIWSALVRRRHEHKEVKALSILGGPPHERDPGAILTRRGS
jgi:hypothetical protein